MECSIAVRPEWVGLVMRSLVVFVNGLIVTIFVALLFMPSTTCFGGLIKFVSLMWFGSGWIWMGGVCLMWLGWLLRLFYWVDISVVTRRCSSRVGVWLG